MKRIILLCSISIVSVLGDEMTVACRRIGKGASLPVLQNEQGERACHFENEETAYRAFTKHKNDILVELQRLYKELTTSEKQHIKELGKHDEENRIYISKKLALNKAQIGYLLSTPFSRSFHIKDTTTSVSEPTSPTYSKQDMEEQEAIKRLGISLRHRKPSKTKKKKGIHVSQEARDAFTLRGLEAFNSLSQRLPKGYLQTYSGPGGIKQPLYQEEGRSCRPVKQMVRKRQPHKKCPIGYRKGPWRYSR